MYYHIFCSLPVIFSYLNKLVFIVFDWRFLEILVKHNCVVPLNNVTAEADNFLVFVKFMSRHISYITLIIHNSPFLAFWDEFFSFLPARLCVLSYIIFLKCINYDIIFTWCQCFWQETSWLYCTICIVLHRPLSHLITLYPIVQHWIALYCTVLHRLVSYWIISHQVI